MYTPCTRKCERSVRLRFGFEQCWELSDVARHAPSLIDRPLLGLRGGKSISDGLKQALEAGADCRDR